MPRAKHKGSRGCCKVEALISVDERGQMVLPKEVRERLGLRGGDKLALSAVERDGVVCCLILTRAEGLADAVWSALGPVAKGLLEDAPA